MSQKMVFAAALMLYAVAATEDDIRIQLDHNDWEIGSESGRFFSPEAMMPASLTTPDSVFNDSQKNVKMSDSK